MRSWMVEWGLIQDPTPGQRNCQISNLHGILDWILLNSDRQPLAELPSTMDKDVAALPWAVPPGKASDDVSLKAKWWWNAMRLISALGVKSGNWANAST